MAEGKRWAGLVALALIAAGAWASWYLFSRGLELQATGMAGQDVCSEFFDRSCDETLLSDYGSFLGMSVAGWGIVYFAMLAFLLLLGVSLRKSLLREANTTLIALNLAGLVVSAVLTGLIVSGRAPVCPICLVTHTINLAILPFLFLYHGAPVKTVFADIKNGFNVALGPKGGNEGVGLKVASLLTTAMAGLIVYQGLALRTQVALADAGDIPASEVIREHFAKDVTTIAIDEHDPVSGPANAPIQIVEFADFECPQCRYVAPLVRRVKEQFGDDVRVTFKNYPLGMECNDRILEPMHRHACGMAKWAIAASLQDRFWPFHDRLMQLGRPPNEAVIRDIADDVGLDADRLMVDAESERVWEILQEDIRAARQARVTGTPAIFVNGRLVTHQHLPQLSVIISAELEM